MKLALLQVILTLNHWLDPQKQDSGSNRLKGWSKVLHHTVKDNRETQEILIKVSTFQKGLVFTQNPASFHGWQSFQRQIQELYHI